MLKFMKNTAFGCIALLSLAACEPQSPAMDLPPETVVTLMAQVVNADKGEDFGGGVTLRGAHAKGKTLGVDINIPLVTSMIPVSDRPILMREFTKQFARGFCGGRDAREFFATGADIMLTLYGVQGKKFSSGLLKGC